MAISLVASSRIAFRMTGNLSILIPRKEGCYLVRRVLQRRLKGVLANQLILGHDRSPSLEWQLILGSGGR
jgi:hypothetical protein